MEDALSRLRQDQEDFEAGITDYQIGHVQHYLYLLMIDFAKFYDSIQPYVVEISFRARRVPEDVIQMMLAVLYQATTQMITAAGNSNPVDLRSTLKQGSTSACTEARFVVDPLVRAGEYAAYVMLNGCKIRGFSFADDNAMAAQRFGQASQTRSCGWASSPASF